MVSLDEFVRLKRGYDLPSRDRRPGGVPILGSFGITGWHDSSKIDGPGVTVGRSGASMGVATHHAGPCWPLNTALYVQDFKGNDPRFVYYVLDSIDFASFNSGAAQPSLNRNYLGAISVWRPELYKQRRVASTLGAFDDLIENNRRRIEILEEMARLLYREWFVHFRFPGHEDVELVDSELGPIPEGWEVATLADYCEHVKRNLTPHKFEGEEFLHYSIPALDADRLPALELGESIRSGKYEMTGDCVLLSKLNPRFPRVWRSRGPYSLRAVCSTEFLVLEPSQDGWPIDYLQCFVQNSDLGERLAQMAGGTSTSHQRVKPGDVMALPIVAPCTELVDAAAEQLKPMNELVLNLIEQNRVLREARDLLLPRLVSGELDVSELDLDGVLA